MVREGAGNEKLGVSDRYKVIDYPEGQINDPSSWKHFSLLFLSATPWASS